MLLQHVSCVMNEEVTVYNVQYLSVTGSVLWVCQCQSVWGRTHTRPSVPKYICPRAVVVTKCTLTPFTRLWNFGNSIYAPLSGVYAPVNLLSFFMLPCLYFFLNTFGVIFTIFHVLYLHKHKQFISIFCAAIWCLSVGPITACGAGYQEAAGCLYLSMARETFNVVCAIYIK